MRRLALISLIMGVGVVGLAGGVLVAPAFAVPVAPITAVQLRGLDFPTLCVSQNVAWGNTTTLGGSLFSGVAVPSTSTCMSSSSFLYFYSIGVSPGQVATIAIPAPTASLIPEPSTSPLNTFVFTCAASSPCPSPPANPSTLGPAPLNASGVLGVVNFTNFSPTLTSLTTPSTFFGYVSTLPSQHVTASLIDTATASADALAPVPEPSSLLLLSSGSMLGMVGLRMRNRWRKEVAQS